MAGRHTLGNTYISPEAEQLLQRHGVQADDLIARHRAGDWGEVVPAVREANERATAEGLLITSRYRLAEFIEVWVVTGGRPRVTGIVTPDEVLADIEAGRDQS